MNKPHPHSAWRLLAQAQGFQGYAFGCRYPSIGFSLEGAALSELDCDRLSACFLEACPNWVRPPYGHSMDWQASVAWLLSAWQALQVAVGLPVYEPGRCLELQHHQARCLLPTLWPARRALMRVIQTSLDCLSSIAAHGQAENTERLCASIKRLANHGVTGSNVPRFVQAAYELGYCIRLLPGGAFQYGVAEQARWLESSFTDVTPSISAKLARFKVWASDLLNQMGLPVPPHQIVPNADEAVKVAQRLGYPIVVKPADQDGGVGVAAGLDGADEVRRAFVAAQKHSKQILVEKHVEGRDYRLTVFNGQVIWAVERIPGSVTGDGQHTVKQLVEQLNADPRRGLGMHAPLKALIWDDEAKQLLQRQALSEGAVPEAGQFVRLRRAANVASGGRPVAVFEQVHPDNARLAVRAANALRLDLAGVDLLIPDIATSWRETGAYICEVNAQPQLGQTTAAHLYATVLKQLISGSGRVPTFLVVGAAEPEVWLRALTGALADQGLKVGSVGPKGVELAGEFLTKGAVSAYAGGQMLALNRSVQAMVVAINDDQFLRTGLPWDRYDCLILAGHRFRSVHFERIQKIETWVGSILGSLLPACDGLVVAYQEGGLDAQALEQRTPARWHVASGGVGAVVNEAVGLVSAGPASPGP